MAQEILTELKRSRDQAELNLLTHQYATYHEYAQAFAVVDTARRAVIAVDSIIKKHLEK